MNAASKESQNAGVSTRTSVTVKASIERTFQVFSEGFDRWWPRGHKLGPTDLDKAIVEPRVGGRWYERDVDGTEVIWGYVLAWEPPRRAVLSWHITSEWSIDPDPKKASEVEVTFYAEGSDRTRVVIEHRHLERHGVKAEDIAKSVGSEEGWPGILKGFARTVESDG